jgi:Cu(I)/Ag(I) efflux system periplasmic protein CusF
MKRFAIVIAAIGLVGAAHAQSGMQGMDHKGIDMKMDKKDAKKSAGKSHHAVGVVKSVDAGKGTVSVQHEPVASLNWPAMTMSFKADKKSLQALKPGQKIEFDFVEQGKDHVITKVK